MCLYYICVSECYISRVVDRPGGELAQNSSPWVTSTLKGEGLKLSSFFPSRGSEEGDFGVATVHPAGGS